MLLLPFYTVMSGVLIKGAVFLSPSALPKSSISMLIESKQNKKRRNATKPGFQRFNHVLIWQE